MYQRDQNKKKIGQSTPYGYQPPQKTFQAQPVSAQPQANLGSQLTQMGAGMAMNKGMEAGIEAATPYVKSGATQLMSALTPSAAAAAPAATVGGAPLTGALASSVAPAATTAATTGAATAGMGAGMAALGTAVPYIGAGLLAGKALGLFSEGGKVYAAEGEKVKMTPEQRASFYNLQISNGVMTPEIAQNALLNEFGMRPGIAQSLIQSQYNTRATPSGVTSLMSNTPQAPNIPQVREVPMMNAPVNPYDEFTQVPRDLQNPAGVQSNVTQGPYIQGRKPEPMAVNPTVANTAAMEDANIGSNTQSSGFNMGSLLGPLALAYILGKR